MDQVVKVAGHLFSKGVHHKVHPFLHHLHLGDYVRWDRIDNGWLASILSFWSTRGVATFRPFLVPSFSTGAFLVLLLGIHNCVLLARLFLKVMSLLGETFHCCCKGLDLSLQGSGAQFVVLIIGGCCH